jgi:hypothetical protein
MSRVIEMLAWSGCPSHPAAEEQLRAILTDAGLADVDIQTTWIEDDETAMARRFIGSPTFRVDGQELIPPGEAGSYGLTCRVYRLADGRYSPLPDTEQLRAAVLDRFAAS